MKDIISIKFHLDISHGFFPKPYSLVCNGGLKKSAMYDHYFHFCSCYCCTCENCASFTCLIISDEKYRHLTSRSNEA